MPLAVAAALPVGYANSCVQVRVGVHTCAEELVEDRAGQVRRKVHHVEAEPGRDAKWNDVSDSIDLAGLPHSTR